MTTYVYIHTTWAPEGKTNEPFGSFTVKVPMTVYADVHFF